MFLPRLGPKSMYFKIYVNYCPQISQAVISGGSIVIRFHPNACCGCPVTTVQSGGSIGGYVICHHIRITGRRRRDWGGGTRPLVITACRGLGDPAAKRWGRRRMDSSKDGAVARARWDGGHPWWWWRCAAWIVVIHPKSCIGACSKEEEGDKRPTVSYTPP